MGTGTDARRGAAYRLAVAGRIATAAAGGYAVAALSAALLSLTLPMERSEAVATGTLLSFAVMVVVSVFVFAARSLVRAAAWVAGLALALGGAVWLAGGSAVAA